MANNSFDQKIKAWITPVLVVVTGFFLRDQYSEIRTDVKALLKSDSQTVITVADLKQRVVKMEDVIYSERLFATKQEEIEAPKRKK